MLLVRKSVLVSERSLLILGTKVEDDLAKLEKMSYPILNIEKVFAPHQLSAKWVSNPTRSLRA